MGESGERRAEVPERGDAPTRPEHGGAARLLLGRVSCALGMALAIGGAISALAAGSATVSAGALGLALGVLGYFLGSERLATATVVLCALALLFGVAASQGLVPGVGPTDRGPPTAEP